MKHVSTTEIIFNTKLIALRRARAGKRAQSWLINRCVDDVVERIIDVNRSFDSILIIGANSLEDQLKKALPKDKYNKIKLLDIIKYPFFEYFKKNHLYIIDPLGNIFIYYEKDFKAKGLKKDIKKILRISRIG